MKTLEISVHSDRSEASLIRISRLLAAGDVNLRAVSVCETEQTQIVKIIVEKPRIAAHILKDAGFHVEENTVLSISLDDRPGAMAEVLELFAGNSIRTEYIYSVLAGREKMADIIVKVNDTDQGEELLKKSGYSNPMSIQ